MLHLFLFFALLAHALAKEARNPCLGRSSPGACTLNRGRYTVGRKLGAGAFGQVWTGTRQGEATPSVAIKFIDMLRNEDVLPADWGNQLRSFRMEVELLRAVSHPHVLRLHESFEENSFIVIITDLAAGDLSTDLTTRGIFKATPALSFVLPGTPAPESLVRRLLHEVGSGVAYIHALGIVHRDIKPDNLLIGRGTAAPLVLADLGISTLGQEYEAHLMRSVPAGDERDMRMNNAFFDKDGVLDADGDGVGDPECVAGNADVNANGAVTAEKRCQRKHISVNGMAGTFPYMAPESRDFIARWEKIVSRAQALLGFIPNAAAATAAEIRAEVARNNEYQKRTLQTEAVDVYSLGATAYALMRGASIDLTGVHFGTDELDAELAALPANYSAALRSVVASMLDANPSSRATMAEVFAGLGVSPIPGSSASSLLQAPAGTCEALADCDDCTPYPSCAWCSTSRKCVSLGGACPIVNNRSKVLVPSACSVAKADTSCAEVSSCGLCAAQASCSWCPTAGGGGTCKPYAGNSCPNKVDFVASCPASSAPKNPTPTPAAAVSNEAACGALVPRSSAAPTMNQAVESCFACAFSSNPSCSFCGGDLTRSGTCSAFGTAADRACTSFRAMLPSQCTGYGLAVASKSTPEECHGPNYGTAEKCAATWTCTWCAAHGACYGPAHKGNCPA